MRRFGSALLVSLLLAGCSGVYYHRVSFFYPIPLPTIPAERYLRTENVFVVIDKTGFRDFAGPQGGDKELTTTEDFSGTLESHALARSITFFMKKHGGQVAAVRVVDNNADPNAFIDRIKPETVLWVRVLSHTLSSEKTASEEVPVNTSSQGNKAPVKTRTKEDWKFTLSAQLSLEIMSYPSRNSVAQITALQHAEHACADCQEQDVSDHLSDMTSSLMESLGNVSVSGVRPVLGTFPSRIIPFEKNSPASVEASTTALAGKWDQAEKIWHTLLEAQPTDWKSTFCLGVAAEHRGDLSGARGWYEQARNLSAASTEAKKQIDFDELLKSLPQTPAFAPSTAPVADLFVKRVAVLPFSDETVSIDGPIFIRQAIDAALAGAGYQTIPLEEVDRILREHGFSDGAQLVAAKNEDVAKWLGADFLFFGNIEKFDDQNIGIYRKHEIAGQLTLWDNASKTDIWMNRRRVKTKVFSKNLAAGFFGGLLNSWVERASKKPLEAEVLRFVILNLETLPQRY